MWGLPLSSTGPTAQSGFHQSKGAFVGNPVSPHPSGHRLASPVMRMTSLSLLLLLPLPAVAAVKNVSTVARLQSALASALGCRA